MSSIETDAPPRRIAASAAMIALATAALGAAALLWLRFGESVYAQSIVNAILSCF
ncbi:MAG: hypothetical protein ACRCTI_20125 [Beijerinckiaceae bacterium]